MRVKVVSEVRQLKQDRPGGWMMSYAADVETEDGTRLTIYSHGAVATKMNQHVNGDFIDIQVQVVKRDDGSRHLIAKTIEGVGI